MGEPLFNEAARRYAEFYDAVEAVRVAFHEEIGRFLREIGNELRMSSYFTGLQIKGRGTRYYHWWLPATDGPMGTHPYLWCEPYGPKTVSREGSVGELVIHASFEG